MAAKEAILPLKDAYQEFVALVRALSDEQFLQLMNGWSPRDITAHLAGWNSLMVDSARSILAGQPPSYYADVPNDYSSINAGFTSKFSSRSRAELLSQLESSMRSFGEFIAGLPDEEMAASHGVVHYSGAPATVAKLVDSLAGDYRHHSRQIRAWLGGPAASRRA